MRSGVLHCPSSQGCKDGGKRGIKENHPRTASPLIRPARRGRKCLFVQTKKIGEVRRPRRDQIDVLKRFAPRSLWSQSQTRSLWRDQTECQRKYSHLTKAFSYKNLMTIWQKLWVDLIILRACAALQYGLLEKHWGNSVALMFLLLPFHPDAVCVSRSIRVSPLAGAGSRGEPSPLWSRAGRVSGDEPATTDNDHNQAAGRPAALQRGRKPDLMRRNP